jgi:hypothetical protein
MALRAEDRFPTPGEFALALEHPEDLARGAAAPVTGTQAALPARQRAASGTIETRSAPVQIPSSGFLGSPTVITAERVVEGEVPESEFPALLEEIRASFERQGYEHVSERSLVWTARRPRRALNAAEIREQVDALRGHVIVGAARIGMLRGDHGAPRAAVSIVSRNGRTRITIEKNLAESAGGIFGGLLGGLGVGGTAVALSLLIAARAPGGAIAIFGVAIPTAVYLLSRTILRAVVTHRKTAIERLADRLADHCEETARSR